MNSQDVGVENGPDELLSLRNGNHAQPRIVGGLDHTTPAKPLGEQTRAVRRQELMVFLANLGVLSTGMALGLPTVTMRQLTDPTERVHLNITQASWFASINTLSTPLGGLLSAFLLDRLGRKRSMYVLNVIALTAWLLMALAIYDNSDAVFIQLMVSRFIIGISAGLSSAPSGVYSAEISLPSIRGRLILGTSIAVASGITLIYLMGYFIRDDWHLIAYCCCAYQFLTLMCIIPLPESPSWLLSKGRVSEAKYSLNYFRGMDRSPYLTHPEVIAEFNVMQKNIQSNFDEKKPSFIRQLRLPEVYKPLFILMGLFAFQQLSGIFVIVVYAVQICIEAGVTVDPFLCAVGIGVGRLVTTLPMSCILEKWGRRLAGLVSTCGMTICMFLLAGHKWFKFLQAIPYLPVIAIVMFIVLSTLGLYTLPFFMISELFPQKVRGPASGVTVAIGMFVAFICIKSYPSMRDTIGNEYCFLCYGVASFAAMIFIYMILPETRGRTLLEIEESFRTGVSLRKGFQAVPVTEVEMGEVRK